MEEISEEEKAMAIYAFHIVLYTNDIALYSVKELKKFVKDKDKETQKKYGAVMKRIKKYDKDLYERLGPVDIYFYADFNGFMDDYFDKDIEGLRRSAEWIFKCNGYTDTFYISKIETAFAMICLAVSIANSYISGLKKNGARTFILPDYKLDEIKKIVEDLYDWTMFLQHKDKVLDLSRYKSIKRYFDRIKANIVDRDIFEKAYSYALKEEQERKQ